MRSRSAREHAFAVWIILMLSGCASTNEPTRWLPEPKQVPADVFGAWIKVEVKERSLSGELIAIDKDTVFLVDSLLRAIPSSIILKARIVTFDVDYGIGAGTVFGTLSSSVNGWFLIFTAPMWMIGGSIAGVLRTYDPIVDYPGSNLDTFRPYARYPQGIPQNLNRSQLRIRPQRPRG